MVVVIQTYIMKAQLSLCMFLSNMLFSPLAGQSIGMRKYPYAPTAFMRHCAYKAHGDLV